LCYSYLELQITVLSGRSEPRIVKEHKTSYLSLWSLALILTTIISNLSFLISNKDSYSE